MREVKTDLKKNAWTLLLLPFDAALCPHRLTSMDCVLEAPLSSIVFDQWEEPAGDQRKGRE